MKKTLKRTIIGICVLAVIIVVLFVVYGLKATSEMKKMTPLETKEIVDNVFAIKSSIVNLYLVKTVDQYIAIDSGNNIETIANELKKLKINPKDIAAIFLTHTDFDHVAAIELFVNAKVYLSEQEEQMVNGTTPRFYSLVGNKIDTENYELLEDKQVLNIDNVKIQGLLIPGHTPGTMCYIVNDKYLFTGDALSIKDGKIDKFNEFFNMDTEMAANSMGKLTGIPGIEYIFTAHYGFSNDYLNAIEGWDK